MCMKTNPGIISRLKVRQLLNKNIYPGIYINHLVAKYNPISNQTCGLLI